MQRYIGIKTRLLGFVGTIGNPDVSAPLTVTHPLSSMAAGARFSCVGEVS